MNEINRKLLLLLIDTTNKKLLSWTRGSSTDEYKTELNSATLTVSFGYNNYDEVYFYVVQMYNGTGGAITIAEEDQTTSDYNLLQNLYNTAKDSCTKESETIDSIIKELSNLGDE